MANNTIQNKVATTNTDNKPVTMQAYVKTMQSEIAKALPQAITPERFTRMVLSALSTNTKLAACTPKSFLGAMMNAAQLGLEPNTPLGQAYLIPFKNHGVDEVQFQIGYKGLIDLAYRSGEIESIQAHIVYENDDFTYAFGLEPKLEHKPALEDRGEAIAVYAVFKTKAGGFGFEVMSIDDCKKHAEKYSQSYKYGNSPWQSNFEEMCKKTVLKRVLKYAPLKSEFVKGVIADGTIKTKLDEEMYNVADETDYEDKTAAAPENVNTETGEVQDNG